MTSEVGGGFTKIQHFQPGDTTSGEALATQFRQTAQSASANFGTTVGTTVGINMMPYGARGLAVQIPSAWTFANIGFNVSTDNATWIPLYNATGSLVQITSIGTATAAVYIAPAETWVCGAYQYLQLSSTSGSTAILQTAARTVTVFFLA